MIFDQREYYRPSLRINQLRRVGFFFAGVAFRFRAPIASLSSFFVAAGLNAAGARLCKTRAR